MFFLKKIISPFILPPGVYIAFLAVFGTYLLSRRKRKEALFAFFLSIALWLPSIRPVSDFLMHSLEYAYPRAGDLSADAIVLLGGGLSENVPDLSGNSALSPDALGRAVEAFRIYRRNGAFIIATGGRVFKSRAESVTAKKLLEDMGVPGEKIITEIKSRDTYENIKNAKKICGERGFGKIIVVTSAYHIPRAALALRKNGFADFKLFGAVYRSGRKNKYGFLDLMPSASSLHDFSSALKEYFGLFFYKIYY